MKVVVIVPTYNESENIGSLITELEKQFAEMSHDCHILVVDDNSPDGTGDIVRAEMMNKSNLHLITGEKNGLGAAYMRGMKHAMHSLSADAVMEMDADFSHKPEDVPRLIAEIEKGKDFVIGSRYVPGGKLPEDWGIKRRMISRWGNVFARYVAGLYKIRDCTAGFRAIHTTLLKKIDFTLLRVQGYAFQMALLNQAVRNGARVQEVPVEFVDRIKGETKLGLSDIIEFMLNAWWIRFTASATFIKFAVVGASGVVVNLGLFTALINLKLNEFIASPISIEASIISNFLINNYWTFSSRKGGGNLYLKGLKFNVVSIISLLVSYSTFVILRIVNPSALPQIHQATGIVPALLVNYFLNSYWTFSTDQQALNKPELKREIN